MSISTSALRRFYHRILLYEAKEIGGGEKCTHNDFGVERIENTCRLAKYDYCLHRETLRNIFEETIREDSNRLGLNVDSFEAYLRELVERGFLINVDPLGKTECYRSIHFDILIRASDLRLNPFSRKMVSTTRFTLTIQRFSDPSDRRYIPRSNGEQIEVLTYNRLNQLLGPEYLQIYLNVFSKYFNIKGSGGFNPYQIIALAKALENWSKETFVITAPTGIGKTELFLALILLKILHDLKQGIEPVIYVVYPRKMLEIDQMERVILLAELLNEELAKLRGKHKKITIYLRDGDTQQIKKLYEEAKDYEYIPFRGIKCYIGQNPGELYIVKRRAVRPKVVCVDSSKRHEKEYDFIIPFMGIPDPDVDYQRINIVVTNLSTFLYRIVDIKDSDIDARHVLKSSLMILDEVHEYNSILLAYIHYLIKTIKFIRQANIADKYILPPPENLKIVLVSATLGNHKEFAQKLSGSNNIADLSYSSIEQDVKELLTGERAIINAYILMHPYVSWQTYISELVAFLDYLYLHHTNKYLNKSEALLPQTIVFINNIRELHRTKSVIENALQLGSPLDNLCVRRFQKQCDDLDPIHNRSVLKHYVLDFVKGKENLYQELSNLNDIVYSGTPLKDRERIANQLRERKIACVLATSSLELGVDYPGVTIVVNLGFDNISSIIQRFGRGGRDIGTLNTVLGILIARNNPIDYKNFFNNDLILKISSHSLGPEYIIPIPTELYSIKYLAALRAILTYRAIRKSTSAISTTIKSDELINYIKELHKLLQDEENLILKIIDKEAYVSLINELTKLLSIDVKNLQEIEEFTEDMQLLLEQYCDNLSSIMRVLNYENSITSNIQKILVNYLSTAYEIIDKLTQLMYITDVELIRGFEKLKKELSTKITELCSYNGKDLPGSLYQEINNIGKERALSIMSQIINHLSSLQGICQKLSDVLKKSG